MTPAHVEARYRNLLASIPRGHQASMNTMRELIDAAQLTRFERGEIWRYGVRHGYLVALNVRGEPSTDPAAKGRLVCQYRRTSKPVLALTGSAGR
jgi:hypothetical protein